MTKAAHIDLTIRAGRVAQFAWLVDEIDMTGWTGKAQIRKYANSPLIAEFEVTIDAENGIIEIEMDVETVNTIPVGRYQWELVVIKSDGSPVTFFEGSIAVEYSLVQL